jgi:hypothetical protein
MLTRRPLGSAAVLALALAAGVWLAASPVYGQLTPDPYNIVGEFNSQYEPFMFAREPNADSMIPNQSRFRSRAGFRGANRFQSYLNDTDSLDGESDPGANYRRSGAGTRYFDAFRRYDDGFGRVYRPNEKADQSFYSDLDERNQKYFEARKEKDPRKRAQLLREYNLEKLRASRSLSSSRSGSERPREGTRPERPGSLPPLNVEGDDLFDRSTRPGSPSAATRRALASEPLDILPSLRAPRPGSGLSSSRSSILSRPLAPQPPTSRGTGLLNRPARGSSSSSTPASVLERNERFDEPPLIPPSTTTAPPPPR